MNIPTQLTADITTEGLVYGAKSAAWSLVKTAIVVGGLYLYHQATGSVFDPTSPAALELIQVVGGSYAGLTFFMKWLSTSASQPAN